MKDRSTKRIIIVLLSLLIAVIVDLTTNILHIANYDNQKNAGNARWQQVEERIVEIEKRINDLEENEE